MGGAFSSLHPRWTPRHAHVCSSVPTRCLRAWACCRTDRAIACDYVKLLFSMAQQEPREHTPSDWSAVTLLGAVGGISRASCGWRSPEARVRRRAWRYWRGSECRLSQRRLSVGGDEAGAMNGVLGLASGVFTETECTAQALQALQELGDEVHAICAGACA